MSNKVLGSGVKTYMTIESVDYPLFCAKTADLSQFQDELEVTSIASALDREYIPGLRNSVLNCAGVTTSSNAGGRVSILYLMQPGVIGTIFPMKMQFTDKDANVVTISFNAFITSANVNRALGGSFSQSSVTMRITGGLVYGDPINPPGIPVCEIQDPLYLDMAEGATSVSDVLLEATGVEILEVQREGTGHDETTGTPGNRQFKFTAGTGTIGFDVTNPAPPGGQVIYVLYKITA